MVLLLVALHTVPSHCHLGLCEISCEISRVSAFTMRRRFGCIFKATADCATRGLRKKGSTNQSVSKDTNNNIFGGWCSRRVIIKERRKKERKRKKKERSRGIFKCQLKQTNKNKHTYRGDNNKKTKSDQPRDRPEANKRQHYRFWGVYRFPV